MAIVLVLVEPVCSLFVSFPKVGYSDEAVDPIRRFKIADSSQCDPRSKLDKIRTKNSFQKLPTRVQNSLPNIKQLPARCIRKSFLQRPLEDDSDECFPHGFRDAHLFFNLAAIGQWEQ